MKILKQLFNHEYKEVEKFKKMKSSAAEIPVMAQRVVDTTNLKDAVALLGEVKELMDKINDHEQRLKE